MNAPEIIDPVKYGALWQKVQDYERRFDEMSAKINKLAGGNTPEVIYEKISNYLLNGWTKGTSRKHLTEDYSRKMKQNAIKQWQEVKASGFINKSKNNRIQSWL